MLLFSLRENQFTPHSPDVTSGRSGARKEKMATEKDQEFVEYVVKAMVDHPDDVSTKRSVDEMGVLIELTVHPEDMGSIIGKEGRTAKSLRTLLRVLGAKNNARVNLKIIEPEGGRGPARGFGEEKAEQPIKAEESKKEEKSARGGSALGGKDEIQL